MDDILNYIMIVFIICIGVVLLWISISIMINMKKCTQCISAVYINPECPKRICSRMDLGVFDIMLMIVGITMIACGIVVMISGFII